MPYKFCAYWPYCFVQWCLLVCILNGLFSVLRSEWILVGLFLILLSFGKTKWAVSWLRDFMQNEPIVPCLMLLMHTAWVVSYLMLLMHTGQGCSWSYCLNECWVVKCLLVFKLYKVGLVCSIIILIALSQCCLVQKQFIYLK